MQIIVNGYPRSGTTWLCRLMADAVNCPLCGFLEERTLDTPSEHLDRDATFGVFKSHSEAQSLRMMVHGRVIYIVRDPRDVMISTVSAWGMGGIEKGEKRPRALRSVIDGALTWQESLMQYGGYTRIHGCSWSWHVNMWLPYAHACCRYEDLYDRPAEELRRICKALGLSVKDKQIAEAVATNDIKKRLAENAPLVRKGQPGEWREVFSEKQKATADALWGDMLKSLGYPRGTGDAELSTALRRSA